jgi:hypothetical protein
LSSTPLSKPQIEEEIPMWVGKEEEEEIHTSDNIYPLLTIETTLAMKNSDEDTFISNFIQNMYPVTIKIDGFDEQEQPQQ